jgi:hypothetical protein
MIFGSYLHGKKDYKGAEREYNVALQLMPESAELAYFLGLLYTDTGDWARAKEHALVAYRKGYPLPALRERLKRAGHWTEDEDGRVAPKRNVADAAASGSDSASTLTAR